METEAYDQSDPASHSYRGRTARCQVMFERGGLAYVYRSYGLHWCINVSCGPPGYGAAVLLRALQPLRGESIMQHRRHTAACAARSAPLTEAALQRLNRRLAVGPGNLCVAMGIGANHNGADLQRSALRLCHGTAANHLEVVATPRIGISIAEDVPWRFVIAGNRYVSASRKASASRPP